MENSPRCLHCKYCVSQDIGYSEWTITGNLFMCKNDKFDAWTLDDEGENDIKTLKEISDVCNKFAEGVPEEHHIDCDIRDEGKCTCEEILND